VHSRLGEIFQTTGMVEIEVGKHDMAHVTRTKAKLFDLSDRRVFLFKLDAIQMNEERAEARVACVDIALTEAGIDENESLICLNEQAVADEASCWTATKAIEERVHQSDTYSRN
jgi:hypothetical protein